ncbi:J domain-containing protein [Aphelenchoides bicaudatus]|nr:J domain-containing protein [Aphelenchoides bicaudatus]
MRSFYSVLGVEESVNSEDLKTAYHQLLRSTHPDKVKDAEKGLVNLVQLAYQTLKNRQTRLAYDNWLREQRLRETTQRVDQTVKLSSAQPDQEVEEDCRCGATFIVSTEELDRVLDYALFECENCSLCLKSRMNTNNNKILLLGDSGVGKSTLVNTLCGTPDARPESTVGVTIKVLAHQFAAGTPQESSEIVELWDVGGSIMHRETAARVFTENVSGLILVHDLSNNRSEQSLIQWINLLEEHSKDTSSPQRCNEFTKLNDADHICNLPTLVVGSYADLAPQRVKDQFMPRLRQVRHYESISLDCRKEILPGSTNRLHISRFFDAVCLTKARHSDPMSNQRRRRFL